MLTKRYLLGLAAGSILLVSLTISSFTIMTSPFVREYPGSFHQERISWTGSAQLSNTYHLDCFRRHYNFKHEKSSVTEQRDASNFFMNVS